MRDKSTLERGHTAIRARREGGRVNTRTLVTQKSVLRSRPPTNHRSPAAKTNCWTRQQGSASCA